ncbi:MAG: WecB/TagA/CpsF family glycosyltransferase [Patescibacteria group bacterium]
MIELVKILDIKVHNLNKAQITGIIEDYLKSKKTHFIATPNPEIILKCQHNFKLKNIINNADLAIPDGFGLLIASKFKIKTRVSGVDVMTDIIKIAEQKKNSILFIINHNGLTQKGDLDKTIQNKYPNLLYKIAFSDEKLLFQPSIIFVGLGCPDQEFWINDHAKQFTEARILMGVGGGIDFLSGNQKRAPKLWQKIGLEWLWRLIHQPNRILRIINAVIIFPIKALIKN